jgi:hypothetical protein
VGKNEQVYVKLQKHLDNQVLGYPATRSGVEIKILKHIFTPDAAEIACCLSYKLEPLETIFSRAGQKRGELNPKSKMAKCIIAMHPLSWGCTNFKLTA